MSRRLSAPPANPRRRRWTAPRYGAQFVRSDDQRLVEVSQIDRVSQMVRLAPCDGRRAYWVGAHALEREYELVAA